MASEMKRTTAEYDASGDKAAYLASKSQTLKNQLAQQKEIFRALGDAVESSARSTGEASQKTDGYRIRMNAAAASVARLERELRDTEREMEELGRDSTRVGRQIEDGIGDAAERTSRSLEEMHDQLRSDIGSIRNSGAVSAMTDLGGAVIGAYQALDGFSESSRDYRRQMSFLEQNAAGAGLEFEGVKTVLLEVAGLTGDIDGAFEGVSNLLAAGFDTSEMELAIETLAGAVIAFPETMKFENLAESLQESIATGEATGAFAELMDRMSVSTEDFAKAMAAAKDEEEKQLVALSFLNLLGLRPTHENYKNVNKELIEAETATKKLDDAWANLGGTIDKWMTPIKEGAAGTINELNSLLQPGGLEAAQKEAKERRLEAAKNAPLFDWVDWWGSLFVPEDASQSAGKGIIDEMKNSLIEHAPELVEGVAAMMQGAGREAASGVAQGIDEASGQAEENAQAAGGNVMTALANALTEYGQDAVDSVAATINAINAMWDQLTMPSLDGVGASYYRAPSSPTGGSTPVVRPTYTVTLNVDGKKFASAVTPYVSGEQARTVGRYSALG